MPWRAPQRSSPTPVAYGGLSIESDSPVSSDGAPTRTGIAIGHVIVTLTVQVLASWLSLPNRNLVVLNQLIPREDSFQPHWRLVLFLAVASAGSPEIQNWPWFCLGSVFILLNLFPRAPVMTPAGATCRRRRPVVLDGRLSERALGERSLPHRCDLPPVPEDHGVTGDPPCPRRSTNSTMRRSCPISRAGPGGWSRPRASTGIRRAWIPSLLAVGAHRQPGPGARPPHARSVAPLEALRTRAGRPVRGFAGRASPDGPSTRRDLPRGPSRSWPGKV